MLPGMAAKPRVAIVGAGNFGTALALALQRARYTIDAVIVRSGGESLKKAQKLAKQVGARALTDLSLSRAELIWFCMPDAEIAWAARSLAGTVDWKGRVVLHSSGALTSDALAVLRSRGATVASVHPLMTFVRGSRPSLAGVPFVLEGDGLMSARFWYGPHMTQWAERWVPYWTGGKGVFAMSAEEDTGAMQALTRLSAAGKADLNRVLNQVNQDDTNLGAALGARRRATPNRSMALLAPLARLHS